MADYEPSLGLEDGTHDLIALSDGSTLRTHGPARCLGPACAIHRPSAHPLRRAPLLWDERLRLLFRVCTHGNMHPDPDSLAFGQLLALARVRGAYPYDGWHPCCSETCCAPLESDVDPEPTA